jgi:predicted ArsR family transcriptional regulator
VEVEIIPSDVAILDLLRKRESLGVGELAELMDVTATAVRQRLNRLLAQGYIDRLVVRSGRGRPGHRYVLTDKGRRKTGANFADLAIALWQEIRDIKDPETRRGLFQRISRRLAEMYESQVQAETVEERMEQLAELFSSRQIPFEVDYEGDLPVLTALACPYLDLAEQDRSICAMERILFSELLGQDLRLNKCRLNGDGCCTFEAGKQGAG